MANEPQADDTTTTQPTAGAGNPAPPVADPPSQPTGKSDEPFATFQTAEAFQERVARASRSHLKKELGIEDIDAFKAEHAELLKLKAEQEERRKAEMTELERLKEENATYQRQAQEYQERAEEIAFDAHIAKLCLTKGIRDAEYAKFRIMQKVETLGDEDTLDENEFLDELLADPRSKAALGVDDPAPPPREVDAKPNTTPTTGAKPGTPGGPPAAPGANPANPPKTAMDMSKEEWEKRKAALGVH